MNNIASLPYLTEVRRVMGSEQPAVTRFREYLRIKTVQPDPDYETAIAWLENQAKEIGLEFNIVRFNSTDSFTVWLTWGGTDPGLKSILLNSHIDVVPVDPSKWTYDPFSAHKDEKGNIYARGSQDMKCVGIQYLEAIRVLKAQGFVPLRTVHVSFVPDEEVGGIKGMLKFVKTEEFRKLNVGFGLDEGVANPEDSFHLYYGERAIWQVKFTTRGQTGHGSLLHENTAAEKIHKIINKMLALRESEKARFKAGNLQLGDVTTINMTMLGGGLQPNVVPPELSVVFDIRVTPNWKLSDMEKILDDLTVEAGPDTSYEFFQRSDITATTPLTDENPWWVAFKKNADSMGLKLNQAIFPAATDSRYIRDLGIPCLGFSPMNNTPILLHDHDEFLNEDIYLRGIEIYQGILPDIINLPKSKSL